MERWQRVRKVVALGSAVVLITALVLYRAGYTDIYMTGSKSTFMFVSGKPTTSNDVQASQLNPFAPAPATPKPGE